MTDKTIELGTSKYNFNYILLSYSNRSNLKLNYFLDQFDINDYYIFKATDHIKQVTIEDFLDFKYAGYILFKKDKYNLEYILMWIYFLFKEKIIYNYIVKPFPPFDPNKIKIIDRYD